MNMKITHTPTEITFTFPRFAKRWNPYDEDGDHGEYPVFTGLIIRHKKNGSDWDEIGFAGTIDMDYKEKPDQVADIIVAWHGKEEDFINKCEELGIGVMIMEI
jgi:hypothetical protein